MRVKWTKRSALIISVVVGILMLVIVIVSIIIMRGNTSVLGEYNVGIYDTEVEDAEGSAKYKGYEEDTSKPDNGENAELAENPGNSDAVNFAASYDTDPVINRSNQELVIEQELFRLINELRVEAGVSELTHENSLYLGARIRSAEAATRFSHTRTNNTSYQTVFEEVGFTNYKMVGENLAYRTSSVTITEDELYNIALLLFTQWRDSPGHYENMINASYEYGEIGVKVVNNQYTAAQLFGQK